MTYFDHNASSPLLPEARAAWLEAEERFPGNPSSPHRVGARAERALEEARERVAKRLGCQPHDIIWTSGATEACNTVLHHASVTGDSAAVAWVSAVEHPAVRESARVHFRDRWREIPVNREGVVELDWIRERLARERPALVAVMAANNETGVLQPWRDVLALCRAFGVPFFCDATQWCGRLPAAGLGACDFVAGSAHKFGGPRGVGFLVNDGGTLHALLHGGSQQERRRAGTENVPGVCALAAALAWCEARIAEGAVAEKLVGRERFEAGLKAALPDVVINGGGAERLWNTVSVTLPPGDCRHRPVVKLDRAGFAVSTGSACASGLEQPSHVLTAMGLTAAEASRALRFSSGWLTDAAAWEQLRQAVLRVQAEMPLVPATGGR